MCNSDSFDENAELKDVLHAFKEMREYAENNSIISYYELATIAYDNDKEDWIQALKKQMCREDLRKCLQEIKSNKGLSYRQPMCDAYDLFLQAKINYKQRHTNNEN